MRISSFGNNKQPAFGAKIGYINASCDMLHPGVIERLRRAREQCDFLYVGIWEDEMIRYYRGDKFPLQSTQERVLMALSCKFVDEVVIGAPFILTKDMINSLNIQNVIHVNTGED
jgi:ethanolamine-phosphate cytidylyltransferase